MCGERGRGLDQFLLKVSNNLLAGFHLCLQPGGFMREAVALLRRFVVLGCQNLELGLCLRKLRLGAPFIRFILLASSRQLVLLRFQRRLCLRPRRLSMISQSGVNETTNLLEFGKLEFQIKEKELSEKSRDLVSLWYLLSCDEL